MYPTYDVDQSYHQGNNIIFHVALWVGQYLDIALSVVQLTTTEVPGPVVRLRHHTCSAIATVDTSQLTHPYRALQVACQRL